MYEKGFGEFSIGRTAGSGSEGAGEADLRNEGDDPNEERRLCVSGGGFIGKAKEVGVPGIEGVGAGEFGAKLGFSARNCARCPKSGGAGLPDDMRRAGRSILETLLCWLSVN